MNKTQVGFTVNPDVEQSIWYMDITKARDEYIWRIVMVKVDFITEQFRKVMPDYDEIDSLLKKHLSYWATEEQLKRIPRVMELFKRYEIISQQLNGPGHERSWIAHRRWRNTGKPIKGTWIIETKFTDEWFTFIKHI